MDGYVVIGTELDTKDFDAEIDYVKSQMEEIEDKLKKADMGFEVGDTQKLEAQYEKLNRKLGSLVKKQQEMNKMDLSNVENNLSNIGDSITKTIRKVGRWALAVFGVRTAYNAVRGAMSTLTQYNEQLATDVEYIRYAIATTLEPIIEGLVGLVYKLLQYVNYLAKAWFNVDLFANASAKGMKKAGAEAKALSKTMAGFDEMNVLNSDSTTGGGGGIPTLDLSQAEVEPPKWLITVKEIGQWIIDNWEEVLGTLLLTKLFFDLLTGNWIGAIIDIIGFVILAIPQIVDAIKALWDNIKILAETVAGWINDKIIKPIANFFSGLWQGIKDGVSNAVQWVKDKFHSIIDFFSNLISKIVGFFKNLGTKVGDVIGSAFKAVINGVLGAIESILNFPIKSINKLIDVINEVPGINLGKLSTFNLPRLAVGGIVNMPGRGVPIGGAIAGERGREGVLPLTDSQAMEELGATIGRYITINANITNTMNGRIISRELQRVQNSSDFATNR